MEPRIIVMEDEPLCLEVMLRMLRRAGFDPVPASSAEQALTICQGGGQPVDALVADIYLPGMNGAEAAKRLVARYPSLKVLFVSGTPYEGWSHAEQDIMGCVSGGTPTFLAKPFSPNVLVDTLRCLLGGVETAPAA